MNKTFLLATLLFASAILCGQTTTSTASIFFETDQSELSPTARQTLDEIAPTLLQTPDYQVDIEAFTDDRGTAQHNLSLAADRAASVQNYLAAKGLVADRTTVQNWGERKAAGPSDLGRQKSRRVDVVIKSFFFNDLESLHQRLSANTRQVLKVQPNQEQTVTAVNGTMVIVPAKAFVFEDGTSPSEPIDLIVQEAYQPSDFILHNLTTTSDGQILQTGGMVRISAMSAGRELLLADDASLTVAIPNGGNFDSNMELFYAQPTSNGSLNWQPTGQRFSPSRMGRVALKIDPSLGPRIAALKVQDYPEPVLPVYKDKMPSEPRMPVAPIKPRAPQKPVWEAVQKSFAGGGDISRLNRKALKKARQYYLAETERYERDSIKYIELEARYQRNLAGYEQSKLSFKARHKDWENELRGRILSIEQYKREQKKYLSALAVRGALKAKSKFIDRYETYSFLFDDVAYAAKRQAEWSIGNGPNASAEAVKMAQKASRLYENIIGTKVIDNDPGYQVVLNQLRAELVPLHMGHLVGQILETTGLRAISDSLQAEIKERQLKMFGSKSLLELNDRSDAYFAEVTRLGWINCDRFYQSPAPPMELVVNETAESAIYAVCKGIKSMLPLSRNEDGTYSTPGLPKGLKVTIVAIKINEGMPQLAQCDMHVGDAAPTMSYQSLSIRELKTELAKLNG